MVILGIETSCDETAAAVVEDGKKLLSNVVASSVDLHAVYGGVVPEIAARSHIESIIPVIEQALREASPKSGDPWSSIDAIGVTYGPGLGGSLLIGVMTARTLAIAKNKPLYAVNHVAAHPYAVFLTEKTENHKLKTINLNEVQPKFPILALIVSGGHTQLVYLKNHSDYQLLGQTQDDAIGEAYDKVAKIIGLPYPGGPNIAKAASNGNFQAFDFPVPKLSGAFDFSYSGLKTAVLRAAQQLCGKSYNFPSFELAGLLNESQKADIAASFQAAAIKQLVNKTVKAYEQFNPKSIIVAGGVAANLYLREQLDDSLLIQPIYPDIKLCTDNAAMIATMAYYQAIRNQPPADPFLLIPDPSLSMQTLS